MLKIKTFFEKFGTILLGVVMKKHKILFVIPAYNEEDNIGKVLNEIKEDVNYADILVINDCSKDNTKKIVEENNVKCITNIFNVKYAMAVQTGIKYAYENGYDYVIQMDGDGQHIAKEAEKLYHTMKKADANLVIEMLREGYDVVEVPVKMRLRESGESMHGGIIKPIKYMINMFYTIIFIMISTSKKKVKK